MRSSLLTSQGRGLVFGVRCTTVDVTFGGGEKAWGGTSNTICASVRQPQITPSRP
ncbi:hypothetical protein D3C80_548020 [compost metagenome]